MSLGQLLENNRSRARGMLAADPEYFARLARQQSLQLRHVQDVAGKHAAELSAFAHEEPRHRRLCELNVEEQVRNISQCTAVQEAWERSQPLQVHGWIYDLTDGLLRDLKVTKAGAGA
jgi:carbonic anhydrase